MIERILSPFDFVLQMTIEEQCWHAVGVSLFAFCIAAGVRETTKNSTARNIARAFGAGAFALVASFAIHATQEVGKLNLELMVRQQHKASEIQSETAITLVSKRGYKVTIGENDGVRRIGAELREHDGCVRRGDGVRERTMGELPASTMGDDGGYGGCNDGLHALAGLFERAKRYAIGGRSDDSAFQLSGEVTGESF